MSNDSINETSSTTNQEEQTSIIPCEIAPTASSGSSMSTQQASRKFNARHAKGLAVLAGGAGAIGTAIRYPAHTLAFIKPFAMIGGQMWVMNKINAKFGPKGGLAVRMIMISKTPGLMAAPLMAKATNNVINGLRGKSSPLLNVGITLTCLFAYGPTINSYCYGLMQQGLVTLGPAAYLMGPAVILAEPFIERAALSCGKAVRFTFTHPSETWQITMHEVTTVCEVAEDFFDLLNGEADEETVALAEEIVSQSLQAVVNAAVSLVTQPLNWLWRGSAKEASISSPSTAKVTIEEVLENRSASSLGDKITIEELPDDSSAVVSSNKRREV